MWIVTGLVMVARPIETVRGEALVAPPRAFDPDALSFPKIGEPVTEVVLQRQPGGPVWIATTAGGQKLRYSATQGFAMSPLDRDEARAIAAAAYAGKAKLDSLTYFPADAAPIDLRRKVPSWQAHYADGTHLYIDAVTGEVLAVRTGWWRIYDFMWGLHTMDPMTRENSNNPFVIVFGAFALAGALLGSILLFRRRKAGARA
jgi:hypothetical protein